MSAVYILEAKRTPFGKHWGALKDISAPHLAAHVIRHIIEQSIPTIKDRVEGVFMGEVLTSGVGQNPARQAALHASLPYSSHAETFNKVCASSLAAIRHASHMIMMGEADCMIAGGMENMSRAPFLVFPQKKELGSTTVGGIFESGAYPLETVAHQSMLYDGLWDAYNVRHHMGVFADRCADWFEISREEQDEYAEASHRLAFTSQRANVSRSQIVPISVSGALFDSDECVRQMSHEKIRAFRPYFSSSGTVTPASSAQIADGAAVLLLGSEKVVAKLNLKPLARIAGWGMGSEHPTLYPHAPVLAIEALIKKTGIPIDEISLFEINEAFAVVPILVMRSLHLPREKVNVEGGAIALGHPIGASGARLVGHLAYLLSKTKKRPVWYRRRMQWRG